MQDIEKVSDGSPPATVTERLLEIISKKGINPHKFYIKSGVGRGILDKKGGMTTNSIAKVIEMYPDIGSDLYWLIMGKDPPMSNQKTEPSGQMDDPKNSGELLSAYKKIVELRDSLDRSQEEIQEWSNECKLKDLKIHELQSRVNELERLLSKYENKNIA